MIELHAHSLLSDGRSLASELLSFAAAYGYKAFAITDHADTATVEKVVDELARLRQDLHDQTDILFLPGVEITHVPPPLIPDVVDRARALGARLVLVHGETIVEPVKPGTNRAAIEGGADILAHPGLISEEDAALAAERGVYLEISARRYGHGLANGHVLQVARKTGAKLVINGDVHSVGDILSAEQKRKVGLGAGMSEDELAKALANSEEIVRRATMAG